MGERHNRLTALDTAFLHQESGAAHMSVGGIATLEGPPPTIEELREQIRRRLHIIPRYRQRLAGAAFGAARPVWVDDPHFDLAFHVRRVAVTPPGGPAELWELMARVFAQRVDRARPLWEVYLIEGLADDRFAVISKHHHALNDGISTVDVLHVLWDLEPGDDPAGRNREDGWTPAGEPSQASLLAEGASELVRGVGGLAARAARAALDPRGTASRVERAVEGMGEVGRAVAEQAPDTPFNVPIGPDRRFLGARYDLLEMKRLKSTLGGTVNDVMLTLVAGGLMELYDARGLPRDGVQVRPIVPVSIRSDAETATLGNRVVTMRPALPLDLDDPVERLAAVRAELERLKASSQPTVVEVLENVMNWVAPPALPPIAQLAYHPRLFNLLISNIPGPQFDLYLMGRRAIDMYACGFLAPRHALAVAAISYNGGLGFGLISDPKVVPDLDVMEAGMRDSLERLGRAADAAVPPPRPAPLSEPTAQA